MKLTPGTQYEILNLGVPQGTPGAHPRITVREIHEYLGQYIVYGTKEAHQQRVYIHGVEDIPERPVVFVILPGEHPRNLAKLITFLRGLPLALREGNDLLYIVNWASRLGKLWWTPKGDTPKTELMERARKVVELYIEWRTQGVMPAWAVALVKAQNGQTAQNDPD